MKIIISVMIVLCLCGCKKKTQNNNQENNIQIAQMDNDMSPIDKKYLCSEPRFIIDSKYFSIPQSDETELHESFNSDIFYLDLIDGDREYHYWRRKYNIPGNFEVQEYRGLSWHYGYNYLVAVSTENNRAIYIKWMNNYEKNYINTDEIGSRTKYLETNLPKDIVLKFYPKVICEIKTKMPKRITMHYEDFTPDFGYIDWSRNPPQYHNTEPLIYY